MAIRILIEIPADFVPVDGDAFDAVRDALAHFDIPATLQVVTEPQP
ncbi:MAG: hypothetical protein AB7P22_16930 [Vicinamibacterales bacterium]